jgi:methionyl-tRNA formyltransferase
MPIRYVFFGTPGFCQPVLNALREAERAPLAVVCQPDRPRGRGRKLEPPPVKLWAQQCSVEVLQPDKCKESGFLNCIQELQPDLGLVFAFGQLLPRALLDIPAMGFINIHPSLLPRYRGAAPIQWALLNGDAETGVTILKVTPKLDDGDMLLQESLEVDPLENAVELGERLARLGAGLAVRALDLLEEGQAKFIPQDEARVVWAPALAKEDGRIDWTQATLFLHNRIRGVQPWPGAFTRLRDKILKIHRASPASALRASAGLPAEARRAEAGQVVKAEGEDLLVRTGDGLLRLIEVQLEGKKRMPVKDFLLGRPFRAGDRLQSD